MQSQNFIILFCLIVLISIGCESKSEPSSNAPKLKPRSITDEQIKQNEIRVDDDDKDRIKLREPYKSLIQTGVRLSISQSKLAKHLNVDTLMDFINSSAYMLSKASTLVEVIKVVGIIMGMFLASSFFYPPLLKNLMYDPIHTMHMDKFLNGNGISERSMLGMLSSSTDNFLNSIGLRDNTCRERSLCYAGDIMKCLLPNTAEAITKFASDNFSNVGLSEHKYVKAFATGFVDRNCGKMFGNGNNSHSCFSSIFSK